MAHGNDTTNSSFLDVLLALRQNIMRTINTNDLFVVRESNKELAAGSFICESIVNSDTRIECISLLNLDVKVNDVVLVTFTAHDFRASLNAYKNGDASTNSETKEFHQKSYGIITGVVYRKETIK